MHRALLTAALVAGLLAPSSAGAAPPAAELSPAVIESYLDRAMDSTGLPGISLVVTHGEAVVHATGAGRDAHGDPVTAHTPMRIASLTKAFTAAAVMSLVDEGRIALDTPVAEQLPEFRMADPRAARITVRHLLNQTSGLSDRTVDIAATQRARSLADYVAGLRTGTLGAEPGAEWAYCNVNYDIAARLVEVVSGRGFGAYLRDRIFTPLGMASSGTDAELPAPPDGFISLFGQWVPRPELSRFEGGGGGSVISTAADMGRWLISQTGHGPQPVTARSLETMRTPVRHGYGMGWGTEAEGGLLTHSGNLFTYNAAQAIDPVTGYGFAVFTNSAGLSEDSYEVMLGLAALSRGETPRVPGGARQWIELTLGVSAAAALGLGVLGVTRARRWARAERPVWRTGLRMLPALVPVLLFAGYPAAVSVLARGRTVTWAQLTYSAAPLTIALGTAAVAGLATTSARLWRLRSVGSGS
ncbi:serine hydrolase domain-containing protein [Nocardia asteroides]|uniref:serine hydrolase domain-containing protein n=1 Tax=Nocardia asteroides TaxID=1824 RepID=UPI001E3B6067|nr:serine hydrolase domain-containing protein [Nocardia asteroides]UGT54748.1 beta-lactamase family protein [Nocardia asteroides]